MYDFLGQKKFKSAGRNFNDTIFPTQKETLWKQNYNNEHAFQLGLQHLATAAQ